MAIAVLQGVAIFGRSPGSRGQQGQSTKQCSSVGVAGESWYDGFELLKLFEDAVNISELIELAGTSDRSRLE